MEKRGSWGSRLTFILASVGSAVGLGNAWRFPGLAAKHGGGTFLLVYLVAMLVLGVPLFMMEVAISRKLRKGAIESMRGINKKAEPIGWAATSNAFVIVTYYSVVFAWVILMFLNSWRFAFMTQDGEAASSLYFDLTKTTGAISGSDIPGPVLACLLIAWGLIFYCIRNGANSVSKVVKFTVFAPVALLLIMVACGVGIFIYTARINGIYSKLLKEEHLTPEERKKERMVSKLSGSYWCLVAAVFLITGLGFNKWEFAGVIFPVAGVLFVAVLGIIKIMADKD